MLWVYDIKMCFILICEPYAWIELIIIDLSPSVLLTDRAGKGARDVTARDQISLFINDILYVLEQFNIISPLEH